MNFYYCQHCGVVRFLADWNRPEECPVCKNKDFRTITLIEVPNAEDSSGD